MHEIVKKKSFQLIYRLYIFKEANLRALIQRVSEASVTVNNELIAEIHQGLLILICAMVGDEISDGERMAAKISKLRIFNDEFGKNE